jgi:hypothetical protein
VCLLSNLKYENCGQRERAVFWKCISPGKVCESKEGSYDDWVHPEQQADEQQPIYHHVERF